MKQLHHSRPLGKLAFFQWKSDDYDLETTIEEYAVYNSYHLKHATFALDLTDQYY